MIFDSNHITTMAEANRNFSETAKEAENKGYVIIFKHNKPKYILLDAESVNIKLYQLDEKPDKIAKRKLEQADWL